MKGMKSLIDPLKGILTSLLIGLLCYLVIYGLRATGLLNPVPFLGHFILNASDNQIFLISCFAAIFYYASNYLSKNIVILCAAIFIFMIIFWSRDKLPAMWQVLVNFWNSIVSLYQS